MRFEPDTEVKAGSRAAQAARIVDVTYVDSFADVRLELSGGMGRKLTPEPGSVPEMDESLCYCTLKRDPSRSGEFPKREDTPWTHGGPPAEYVPTNEDAVEAWA